MLRAFLLAASLIACCEPALADICGLTTKPVTDQAISLLRPNAFVLKYCGACGDKIPKRIQVIDASAEQDKYSPELFQLIINKSTAKPIEIDIAYTYVLGGKDNKEWVNLGRIAKCAEADSDYEFAALPSDLIQGSDKTPHDVKR